jgi:hypothetical protein
VSCAEACTRPSQLAEILRLTAAIIEFDASIDFSRGWLRLISVRIQISEQEDDIHE